MSELTLNTIHTGDATETLRELPASSVHMCMTSPPYFGLRDYGVDGQLGLEESLDEYVAELVDVCDAIRHVLRPDGSLWLNLGDSYDDSKNKMLVPHRVAIALQRDGWIVRNDVTWLKPNPMPQSVKDRLNTTTEQIFHLVPQPNYYYDLNAIREPHSEASKKRMEYGKGDELKSAGLNNSDSSGGIHAGGKDSIEDEYNSAGKNPGDVFEVTTKPFPDAHFAVYPPELCEKPIKATCPEGGIVLDPFAGAGTTLMKAKDLGRQFVGVELNPEYADMARVRCGLSPADPSHVRDDGAQTGLESYDE